ncbi:hypothetical protein H0H92_011063 [Tricholoma furcatifolium]|nr:hypothetical protein H0H92_011063 [Tricholoma furcatifolium]
MEGIGRPGPENLMTAPKADRDHQQFGVRSANSKTNDAGVLAPVDGRSDGAGLYQGDICQAPMSGLQTNQVNHWRSGPPPYFLKAGPVNLEYAQCGLEANFFLSATSGNGMPAIRGSTQHPSDDDADGLRVGHRRKTTKSDPYVGYGRHFARAVYAFGNVRNLITNGLKHEAEQGTGNVLFTPRQLQEQNVYKSLLAICQGLGPKLLDESTTGDDIEKWADMVRFSQWLPVTNHLLRWGDIQIQKGASGARGDDTKGIKAAVIDWITPKGESLVPPLNRRQKVDRGFHHEVTGGLLCPAHLDWKDEDGETPYAPCSGVANRVKRGLRSGELIVPGHSWPKFLYENSVYNPDDPWRGLLKSTLLVMAFKHVFIAPSSVDSSEPEISTKGGNAFIHGMKQVTRASLVYTATQLRFALSSASSWSRTDRVTDSETFYSSLLDTLNDPGNSLPVAELLAWWDQPDAKFVPAAGSPLERIRQIQVDTGIAQAAAAAAGLGAGS